VLVQTEAAGICGSEVEAYLGRMANRTPPLVMGHEYAGLVTEVGEGVDRVWSRRRVAVNPIVGCGRCRNCAAGDRNLCPDRHLLGIAAPGGFAAFSVVPERCLFSLPEGMDARLGALTKPLANGVHLIRKSGAGRGRVVVIGAGTIGLGCLQAALLHGAEQVDVVERHPGRRRHALALGARQAVAELADVEPGADLVVDAAGPSATVRLALEVVRRNGQITKIAWGPKPLDLSLDPLLAKAVTLQGVFSHTWDTWERVLRLEATGQVQLGPLISHRVPLADWQRAFDALESGAAVKALIFPNGVEK